jgi:2-hydroxy-3-oxopropionate reductase
MRVAIIGVGVMGSAIAARLQDTGAEVRLFDKIADRVAPLLARGAYGAKSALEATRTAQFVITSLNSAAIVEQAVFGSDGIAGAATADQLLVDMSSIDPQATRQLAARLQTTTGMAWIDAPLSGGAPAAATGSLTLMIGGAQADVARAEPLLSRLAARHTHLGACGAGQTAKLVNQLLCASNFIAVAEAVCFAEALGIDAARLPAALAGGRADSRILQEFMAKMARRDFSPTGRIDNMLKDLLTVQTAMKTQGLTLPVTALVTDLHRQLIAAGLGPADSAQYVRLPDLVTATKA